MPHLPYPHSQLANVLGWGISPSGSIDGREQQSNGFRVLLAMSGFSGARLCWFNSKLGALSCEARSAEARSPKD